MVLSNYTQIRMLWNQTTNLDLLASATVVDRIVLLQRALVDTHVRELTVATIFELECQRHGGLGLV